MAFNLRETLQGAVSNLGTTGQDQIEYIDIDKLFPDPENFYELSGLDSLASSIALVGIQQPLRVRLNPDDPDTYIIVSGHRRRAASQILVDEGNEQFRRLPCIKTLPRKMQFSVEPEAAEERAAKETQIAAIVDKLLLILNNSDTRPLSSFAVAKQAAEMETSLYRLKELGVEFPGRMRDQVAEAVKVSKSRLARLKVIREKLIPKYLELWERAVINESVAYELAKLPAKEQDLVFVWGMEPKDMTADGVKRLTDTIKRICNVKCKLTGDPCGDANNHLQKQLREPGYAYCAQCCEDCSSFLTCSFRCPLLEETAKTRRAEEKAAKKEERERVKTFDEHRVHMVRTAWKNFATARAASGKDLKEVREAAGLYFTPGYRSRLEELEAGNYKYTPGTEMPFAGASADFVHLSALADALGVTTDYLLGRTPEDRAQLAYRPGDRIEAVGRRLNFEDLVGMVGRLVVSDCSTESRTWYKVVRVLEITMDGSANRRAIYDDGTKSHGAISEIFFSPDYPHPSKVYALPVPDEAADESPGPKWLHLSFIDALLHPTPDEDMLAETKRFYCVFDCEGSKQRLVAEWRPAGCWEGGESAKGWHFPHGAKIDAKCLMYFPLPEEERGIDHA